MKRADMLRWLAVGCALYIAYFAVVALGIGPAPGFDGSPPDWVDTVLSWILLGSVATVILVSWRGLTPGVSAFLVTVGLVTYSAGQLLATLSYGIWLDSSPVYFVGLAVIVLTGVGIWTVDVNAIRSAIRAHPVVVTSVGVAAIGVGLLTGVLSTTLWLAPLLWAGGIGVGLAPLALLAGLRWIGSAGILVSRTVGFRRSTHRGAGIRWDRDAVLQFEADASPLRAGGIVVVTIGALVILLAPQAAYYGTTSLPTVYVAPICGPRWGDLGYVIDWEAIYVRWSNGCTTRSNWINPRSAVAGVLLLGAGLITDRLAMLRER